VRPGKKRKGRKEGRKKGVVNKARESGTDVLVFEVWKVGGSCQWFFSFCCLKNDDCGRLGEMNQGGPSGKYNDVRKSNDKLTFTIIQGPNDDSDTKDVFVTGTHCRSEVPAVGDSGHSSSG
jgi:hypothetical protein